MVNFIPENPTKATTSTKMQPNQHSLYRLAFVQMDQFSEMSNFEEIFTNKTYSLDSVAYRMSNIKTEFFLLEHENIYTQNEREVSIKTKIESILVKLNSKHVLLVSEAFDELIRILKISNSVNYLNPYLDLLMAGLSEQFRNFWTKFSSCPTLSPNSKAELLLLYLNLINSILSNEALLKRICLLDFLHNLFLFLVLEKKQNKSSRICNGIQNIFVKQPFQVHILFEYYFDIIALSNAHEQKGLIVKGLNPLTDLVSKITSDPAFRFDLVNLDLLLPEIKKFFGLFQKYEEHTPKPFPDSLVLAYDFMEDFVVSNAKHMPIDLKDAPTIETVQKPIVQNFERIEQFEFLSPIANCNAKSMQSNQDLKEFHDNKKSCYCCGESTNVKYARIHRIVDSYVLNSKNSESKESHYKESSFKDSQIKDSFTNNNPVQKSNVEKSIDQKNFPIVISSSPEQPNFSPSKLMNTFTQSIQNSFQMKSVLKKFGKIKRKLSSDIKKTKLNHHQLLSSSKSNDNSVSSELSELTLEFASEPISSFVTESIQKSSAESTLQSTLQPTSESTPKSEQEPFPESTTESFTIQPIDKESKDVDIKVSNEIVDDTENLIKDPTELEDQEKLLEKLQTIQNQLAASENAITFLLQQLQIVDLN